MPIQKPTVLDAARICEETRLLCGAVIRSAFKGHMAGSLFLKLSNPETYIKYIADKRCSYLGITDGIPENAPRAFPGIEGFSIIDSRQINNDRIISFELSRKDGLGRTQTARLIFEIMPNIGNVFFTDGENRIKAALKRKNISSYKAPGPLKRPTVLNIAKDQIQQIMIDEGDISKEVYGFSRRDLLNLSFDEHNDPDELFHDIRAYIKQARNPGPAWIIQSNDEYSGFSLVAPMLSENESAIEFANALSMYEEYYSKTAGDSEAEKTNRAIIRTIENGLKKSRAKISRIKKQMEEAEMAPKYKLFGELILANLENIKKGAKSVIVNELGSDGAGEITINLDPSKSPVANANNYFKKSQKGTASKEILLNRLLDEEKYHAELEKMGAMFPRKLKELESGLIKLGLLSAKPGNNIKKPVEKRKPYRRFKASCGWDILVGKSNKDNDELTFHIASRNDFWLHAWQAAGSHTVLKLPDKSSLPDKQTLLEAASLAAYYSKARNSSKVAVAYTRVKHVRKPRKFPPGKVLVEREKQLMVKPANPDNFAPDQKH